MAVAGVLLFTFFWGQTNSASAVSLTKQEIEQRALAEAKAKGVQGDPTKLQVKRTTYAEVNLRFGQVMSPRGELPRPPTTPVDSPLWLAVVRGKFLYRDPGTLPERDGVVRPPLDERDTLILVWEDKKAVEVPMLSLLLWDDNPATHWLSPEALDLEAVPPANPTPLPWRTPLIDIDFPND